jgi:hypothetical protein
VMGITEDEADGDLILHLRDGGKLQMYEVRVSESRLLASQPQFWFGNGMPVYAPSQSYAVYAAAHDGTWRRCVTSVRPAVRPTGRGSSRRWSHGWSEPSATGVNRRLMQFRSSVRDGPPMRAVSVGREARLTWCGKQRVLFGCLER